MNHEGTCTYIDVYLCFLQDWALGVLHAKIIAAITLMGPQWWLKTVIEQVCFRCILLANKSIQLNTES